MINDLLITLQFNFEWKYVGWTTIIKFTIKSLTFSIMIVKLWNEEEKKRLKNILENFFRKTWWILEERTGYVPLKVAFDRDEWRWGWCDDNADVVIVLINVETVWALCKSVTGPLRREECMSPSVFIFLFFFFL
jgi:hypothetical protein